MTTLFAQRICLFAIIFIYFSEFSQSHAADFRYVPESEILGNESIIIDGKIESGDFEKFKEFLLIGRNLTGFTNRVWLKSPGGDVSEAMKFATLFDKSSAEVGIGPQSKCYSACFIMYAGGVTRTLIPSGELGVHRISLSKIESDIGRVKSVVSPASTNIYNYLIEQGIPRAIIDKMMETPATAMFRIDHITAIRTGWYSILSKQPIFFDATEKACGKLPDPYPDESLEARPRDEVTKQKIKAWVTCAANFRYKNTYSFIVKEHQKIKENKSSIFFPKGRVEQAMEAFMRL